jgi:hypothetical protein
VVAGINRRQTAPLAACRDLKSHVVILKDRLCYAYQRFAANHSMPTISSFFGIVIQMFWREHSPPHFHALYGEHEALIDIRTMEVFAGSLPRRALSLTIEWAIEHRHELMEDWNLCQSKQMPRKIPPLE